MSVQEYRHKEVVRAEKVEESSRIVTANGVADVYAGDYIRYTDQGIVIVSGEAFERDYEEIPESVSEARKFLPAGKRIDEVLEFMRENPDEVDRVKQAERDGTSRKGILEYEVR